ncbi:fungal-specific transcription factor domain-containing protein [Phyllosticta capitalensis]
MSAPKAKTAAFACTQCKSGKRKCDGLKPHCSLCSRLGKSCVYPAERHPKKRKYWDEDYVKGLEQQVQALLSVVKTYEEQYGVLPCAETPASLIPASTTNDEVSNGPQGAMDRHRVPDDQPEDPCETTSGDSASFLDHQRSQVAMEEVSIMMWRMNLGDGATIMHDSGTTTSFIIDEDGGTNAPCPPPPPAITRYCRDHRLLSKLGTSFLQNINQEHQFTRYQSLSFLENYPHQEIDKVFLHTAMVAAGAAFLASQDSKIARIGEEFAKYAESLIFDCCRNKATLSVIQGMCILSFRSLSIGKDHLGWMFISIAGGLCVHLRLHVLAVDECAARFLQPTSPEVRTFWMFYFVDKSAITILGRNCALPWRRVNVPQFDSTFDPETADLAELSFAWQCKLWYSHDAAMDQIFASSFESLPLPQQIRLLVSTLEQLNAFFRSRPPRLHMSPEAPKPVLLFHLQYHMAVLITISNFLRVFSAVESENTGEHTGPQAESILLVLRSITSSAIETVRLCRVYRDKYSYAAAHPILLHHLLSAALVHLMNATSSEIGLRRQSARWLRTSVALLKELRVPWPVRVDKAIKVIRVLAQKWGVLSALPLDFAGISEPFGNKTATPHLVSLDSHVVEADSANWDTADYPSATREGFAFEPHMPDTSSAPELLATFESLASLSDLSWLSDPAMELPFT